ncbi:5'/3'-nucleotidase SurE [Oceanispirochaeta crateris]|uniref:5'-nucleotidase SurE n=1 Tax=Oceanispirochaeta crateris TaxID=2518645 RepID=A0A5C1QPI4_9SPIO|nr:5'/3'-nucleotidase SurE [Oceanispirochaeta crateris]QEN08930.1 5'/3'-nucleotidase SurE [Oceanispirochaeta crateris]
MNILLVNDDGIESPGIQFLAEVMKEIGKVFIVAPHTQQSAIGHGITIHEPFRVHHRNELFEGIEAWSLEAKPADCVKFAFYALALPIDLVVSGINDGPNLGTDITYSGTLAGASESIICGVPAIALSADFASLETVKPYLRETLKSVLDAKVVDKNRVININFPKKEFTQFKGFKITEMGERPFNHQFVEENGLYWSRGNWDWVENGPETDVWAWENGYVSISPIQINRTDFAYMDILREKL